MASDKMVGRRRQSEGLKAEVMAECDAPGASVAKVATARGINANVVHHWRQLARDDAQGTAAKPREFAAVAITPQVGDLDDLGFQPRSWPWPPSQAESCLGQDPRASVSRAQRSKLIDLRPMASRLSRGTASALVAGVLTLND